MKKLGMWVLTSVLACGSTTYTVDELVLKALENSPDISITDAQYKASQSRKDIAFSGYLPVVDLHVSGGKMGVSDTTNSSNKILNDSILLGQLSLNQLIYDFGKTGGNYDSYKYDSISLSNQHKQNISNKIKDVKTAYYSVLQAIALIKVNQEDVALNEKQLYRAKKYFGAGIRTKIDVSDAKVSLIQSKLDLKKSEYDLKLAYATLDETIGFSELENNYHVYFHDLVLNELYSTISEYPLTLKESIEFAYENREELKQYKASLNSAKAQKRMASAEYYPSIYASADYTRQEVDKLQLSTPKEQYNALINLDWNIYQGGSSSALNEERRVQESLASSQIASLKLSIKKLATEAFINVNKMKDSVELSQSLLEVSKEKFVQAGKRYEYGLSDYIELQEARQDYINAMVTLVINYYNYYTSVAQLDNAIGK